MTKMTGNNIIQECNANQKRYRIPAQKPANGWQNRPIANLRSTQAVIPDRVQDLYSVKLQLENAPSRDDEKDWKTQVVFHRNRVSADDLSIEPTLIASKAALPARRGKKYHVPVTPLFRRKEPILPRVLCGAPGSFDGVQPKQPGKRLCALD
jgi:hypothetical protein